MKTTLSIICAMILLAACQKSNTSTPVNQNIPPYVLSGLQSVTLTNYQGSTGYKAIPIAIESDGYARELVTLTVSGLPAGITLDSTWVSSGYPTFNTTLVLYDTSATGAATGIHSVTVTATGAISGAKTYTFQLTVASPPPCSAMVTGKFYDCYSCTVGTYTDSIYADPVAVNKIWFTNFNNSGHQVYALLNCNTQVITVPAQVAGGNTYSGSGTLYNNEINLSSFTINNTTSCYMDIY